MTQKTESAGLPAGQTLDATYHRSVRALESAESQLHSHLGGQRLGKSASLSISSSLAEALRDLYSVQLAAEPGSEEAQQARDGLRRFDRLLMQIAEAGLLPER
jgi:hypothetical protein